VLPKNAATLSASELAAVALEFALD